MKPFNVKILYRRTALVIYDIISIVASSVLAILIRYEFSYGIIPGQFRHPIERFLPINVVITLFLFYIFRLYSSLWAYAGETELQSIVISCFLSGLVNLIGIESPGLTASMPAARMVRRIIGDRMPLEEKEDFVAARKAPVRFRDLTEEEQAQLICEDPEYGELICRCQKVTKREIRNAIENPFGARSISAIKYRAWATTGRCNGGYCLTRIVDMLIHEYGMKPEEITYRSAGSEMFDGKVK